MITDLFSNLSSTWLLILIANGFAKFNGSPFIVLVPGGGSKIVLPSSLSDWVKTNRDLDHQELVRQEYFARYSGFEAQYAIHHPWDRVLIDTLRTKLSQHIQDELLKTVSQSIEAALDEYWGNDTEEWHTIDWERDTTGLISRAAASVFTYVKDFLTAVGTLQMLPKVIRPIVHRFFLPQSSSCRVLIKEARILVEKYLKERTAQQNDFLSWAQQSQSTIHSADIQLGLAVAALFTTTEALKQALVDIALNPSAIPLLRKEVSSLFQAGGLTQTSVNSLSLLDSTIKESQRLTPFLTGLERIALNSTTLPNSKTVIPKGSITVVSSLDQWNPLIHQHPDKFNENRFFAANELKLSFVHILEKYDVRIKPDEQGGKGPKSVQYGFFAIVDPGIQFEVRRRKRKEEDVGVGL
ncbi:cytochrome P450 [Podospora fimiseda]|uniref:Cytochrome P450 n=1 Tax=Podospora fimiseda TaxID=252190 RepID=A0AAN7BV02_9PEZI|nr:cytochrome P450 [Podospora fimiseda]